MPKCPNCGTEISCLNNYCSQEHKYVFCLVDDKPEYTEIRWYPTEHTNDYCCPECLEVIATSEDRAIRFLKGEL